MEFEDIYQKYLSEVYLFLLRLSGNEDVAEELTQETFSKAFANIGKFRGTCKLNVWLCQIAKNTYYTWYSKQKRQISADAAGEDEAVAEIRLVASDNTENEVIDSITGYELHRILHKIPEPYKEVFMLRVFGELKFKEIAEIFEKTESWARVTYYRAKEMIRRQIEGGGNDEM